MEKRPTSILFVILFSLIIIGQQLALSLYLGNNFAAYAQPDGNVFKATGSNYFDIKDDPSLRLAIFSLAAWFKTSATFNETGSIVNKGGFGAPTNAPGFNLNYGIWFGYKGDYKNKVRAGFEDGQGKESFVSSANTMNDGKWHYAVVTYDQSSLRLFVDGKQVSSNATTIRPDNAGSQPLRLGADSQYGSGSTRRLSFVGSIDDVRVWSRALTASEISNQYSAGQYSPSGLIVYMDGISTTWTNAATTNHVPVAVAGPDQTVNEGTLVTLDSSGSYDSDNGPQPMTYKWEQVSGPTVTLSSASASKPTFTAPQVSSDALLQFKLTVSDGADSSSDTVNITVKNVSAGGVYRYDPFYTFVGSTYEEVLDSSAIRLTKFSVAAWFQTNKDYSGASVKALIVNKGGFGGEDPGKNMNYGIWIENGATSGNKIGAGFESSSGPDYFLVSPNKYNDGIWHYVEVTFDGSVLRLYVDGLQVNSLTTSAIPDNTGDKPLRVGANSLDYSRYFTGSIDEVRIWNRAVSSQEAADQYSGIFQSQGQLVYMDGGTIVQAPIANKVLMTRGIAPSGEPNYRDDLAAGISNAKKYVYASMYYVEAYSTNSILNNLELAVNRGIEVRLMIANQSIDQYPTMEADLQARGIPYKIVDNHAKVVVIDDKVAYVGSANWNKNGLENNWELTLKTNNPNTIAEAKQFDANLWVGTQKAPVLKGYLDENFVSGTEYVDLLINKLKVANSVKLLMFEATYDFSNQYAAESKVMNEIKNAYQRGTNLQLVFDDPRYCVNYGGQKFLTQNNIPHKLDDKNSGSFERLHAKAILIDDSILFIGSQNWNKDSIDSILEASIMTTNKDTISEFKTIFDAKWNLGKWRSDYNPCIPDFSISASPTSLNVLAGQSATSTITVTSINGSNAAVTLTVSPIITGVTTNFSANPITPSPGGTASSTLTISTSSSTTKGTYTLTITGSTSSTPQHKTTISLTIS